MRKGLATHHALRNGFAIATPSTQIDPLRSKWVGTESRFVVRSSKRAHDRQPVFILIYDPSLGACGGHGAKMGRRHSCVHDRKWLVDYVIVPYSALSGQHA